MRKGWPAASRTAARMVRGEVEEFVMAGFPCVVNEWLDSSINTIASKLTKPKSYHS
jgi:hypothetical protein